MEIIRQLNNFNPLTASVLTIGSYDGIHRGHHGILTSVVNHANARSVPSVLVTFDPHPRHILDPVADKLSLIMGLDQKLEIIESLDQRAVIPVAHHLDARAFSGTLPTIRDEILVPSPVVFRRGMAVVVLERFVRQSILGDLGELPAHREAHAVVVFGQIDMPGLRRLALRLVQRGDFLDVRPDWLQREGFGLRRNQPRLFAAVGPVHLNQAHYNVRVPMEAVAVIDVQRVI